MGEDDKETTPAGQGNAGQEQAQGSSEKQQGSDSSEQKSTIDAPPPAAENPPTQTPGPAVDQSEVEDGTVVKEVDLKDIHFSIVKRGEGFEVKRGDEVVGRDLTSVDDASRFIHVFCYGASTV